MIELIMDQRRLGLGGSFEVGRVLPFAKRPMSSSMDRLAQAAEDWKAGGMRLPDADAAEFIPLPAEPAPAVSQMS